MPELSVALGSVHVTIAPPMLAPTVVPTSSQPEMTGGISSTTTGKVKMGACKPDLGQIWGFAELILTTTLLAELIFGQVKAPELDFWVIF